MVDIHFLVVLPTGMWNVECGMGTISYMRRMREGLVDLASSRKCFRLIVFFLFFFMEWFSSW